jgi:predicted RNase H-like HicB family nuclease/predicted RNA binding protein YcfA (HicA-like mRNA interferase family)
MEAFPGSMNGVFSSLFWDIEIEAGVYLCPLDEEVLPLKIKVVLEPQEEGGFTVLVPSLPGCISEGDRREDALRNIKEAIELYFDDSSVKSSRNHQVVEVTLWAVAGKLPVASGREVVKALSKAVFRVRQKGSHVRLEKTNGDQTIKLTVPMHETLKKGTLNQIVTDSGLSTDEFLKLLWKLQAFHPRVSGQPAANR